MADNQLKQSLKTLDDLLADAADTIEVLAAAQPQVPAEVLAEAADVERRLRAHSSEISNRIHDLAMQAKIVPGSNADQSAERS